MFSESRVDLRRFIRQSADRQVDDVDKAQDTKDDSGGAPALSTPTFQL
ncbi:hypothetical protein CIHG_08905 [Coccidioides immitis H538.4]|uniref:Uncharacterized protein n=3 Tax=Coccidioides immitis TaxID=5501 RepID=A0A0J8TVI9_COCIT|nr:hypothetical protein CIRG_05264 [Coccidioides immitis RMSCC 2394]KMU77892.1 hypothetical protein CISG_06735 [Coccidioides immitis RMSCC 3703]KMU91156.1 hypothetical protein CIHG_08905 [Coccidioides immitis H538.4]